MLFNSDTYIFIFLPASLLVFYILKQYWNNTIGTLFLALVSLSFYTYWNPYHSFLLLGSVIANFYIGQAVQLPSEENGKRRRMLALGIGLATNLSPLIYFKYLNFLKQTTNAITSTSFETTSLVLPLAISFFTFQQISYLVDCYRGQKPESSFLHYCLYVTFFPQLIAGPIVRYRQIGPQLHNIFTKLQSKPYFHCAISLISVGLFKKVVIADNLAPVVDAGYSIADSLSIIDAWLVTISFTLQIYYDFSGYSDIAIGSALLFGVVLPQNFGSPYQSTNIRVFWKRWHMTLSLWFFEYVYKPLGGNRKILPFFILNILFTFFLSGLWHGAGWTFIIWGLIHGFAVIIFATWKGFNIKLPAAASWIITFLFINISWIFFRAHDLGVAIDVIQALFDFRSFENNGALAAAVDSQQIWSLALGTNINPATSIYLQI